MLKFLVLYLPCHLLTLRRPPSEYVIDLLPGSYPRNTWLHCGTQLKKNPFPFIAMPVGRFPIPQPTHAKYGNKIVATTQPEYVLSLEPIIRSTVNIHTTHRVFDTLMLLA